MAYFVWIWTSGKAGYHGATSCWTPIFGAKAFDTMDLAESWCQENGYSTKGSILSGEKTASVVWDPHDPTDASFAKEEGK